MRALSVGECLREATEHLTEARATSDAEVREQYLALARAFIELATELENGPKVVEFGDVFIARGAKGWTTA